jgi:hypothetical protein
MDFGRPDIAESESLGRERLNQLAALQAGAPEDFLGRLASLPWVRFREVIDHTLDGRRAMYLPLLELVLLLEAVATKQRGPGILGYFTHIELSFSTRADASYSPQSRVISISLGFPMLANELESTCEWLASVLFGGPVTLSLQDLARQPIPPSVRQELSALYQADGRLAVSRKRGMQHPIANTFVRFVLAHELAHLVDFAESPRLQASWRETVWSDYQDALDYSLATRAIDRLRYSHLLRSSLEPRVAEAWATEFLADGLAFHMLSSLPPPKRTSAQRASALLQAAVELFFHVFVLAYRADGGTASHPPPTLRSAVIRARRRKDHRASWPQFLSEYWGAGLATSELLATAMRSIGGKP